MYIQLHVYLDMPFEFRFDMPFEFRFERIDGTYLQKLQLLKNFPLWVNNF